MAKTDRYWMERALVLARKGIGNTQPNPLVGAIVLDPNGKCVGRGFHPKAGRAHAEILALNEAGEKARGGTLYVTLEPCSHFGKTAPCVDRVIQSGVNRVVVANIDSNPIVNGKGVRKLLDTGLKVEVGCLQDQAKRMNLPFFHSIKNSRPFVTAKVALSKDGKLGVEGKRIQISGPECEQTTMRLRANAGAILIGIQTLLTDDPKLTVRGKYSGRKPIRAILDPDLRTPPTAKIFDEEGEIWIFCKSPQNQKINRAKLIAIASEEKILNAFHGAGITSVLIEGGAKTFDRFANAKLIDRWYIYRSPQVLGETFEGKKTIPFSPAAGFPIQEVYATRRGLDQEIVANYVHRDH